MQREKDKDSTFIKLLMDPNIIQKAYIKLNIGTEF